MRVLVTGSEGFLGRAISARLSRAGYDVVGFDARLGQHSERREDVAAATKGVDAVVHFGSPSSVVHFRDDLEGSRHQTVEGMKSILDYGPDNIVIASTCTLYGNSFEPVAENADLPPAPNPYAEAKRECEKLCLTARADGRDVKMLRVFTGYGPGEEAKGVVASPLMHFAKSVLEGAPIRIFGTGEQARDFVYVDDVARAFEAALKTKTEQPIFNVGTGRAVAFNELAGAICRAAGRSADAQIEYVGEPKGYVGSIRADDTMSADALNFKAKVSVEEGIERTLHHLKTQGQLTKQTYLQDV